MCNVKDRDKTERNFSRTRPRIRRCMRNSRNWRSIRPAKTRMNAPYGSDALGISHRYEHSYIGIDVDASGRLRIWNVCWWR